MICSFARRRLDAVLRLTVLVVGLLGVAGPCGAQCTLTTTDRGGETTAVGYVDTNVLLVAEGRTLKLKRWANVDAVPTTAATYLHWAPIIKISKTVGNPYTFVLGEDGFVVQLFVTATGQINSITYGAGEPLIGGGFPFYKDILAEGAAVYAVSTGGLRMDRLNFGGATAVRDSFVSPAAGGYRYDRVGRAGSGIWVGYHDEDENGTGTIYGVDGFSFAVPGAPVRLGVSNNFTPNFSVGNAARVSAIGSIGSTLYVTYDNNNGEDWMRGVDVTNPVSAVWRSAVDLNSVATGIAAVANQLHVAVEGAGTGGISVWNAANPGALSWIGTTFIPGSRMWGVVAVTGTDYAAAGGAGLYTLNSANTNNMAVRTATGEQPRSVSVARQYGNKTIAIDESQGTLRVIDYTLAPGLQLQGSVAVAAAAGERLLELSVQPGGAYACVSSYGSSQVQVFDINNPNAPFLRSTVALPTSFQFFVGRMAASGARLYVAGRHFESSQTGEQTRMEIVDLSNVSAPVLRGSLVLDDWIGDVAAMAAWTNRVALGTFGGYVRQIDTTAANTPVLRSVWGIPLSGSVSGLAKGPSYLYIASRDWPGNTHRIDTVDVTDGSALLTVATVQHEGFGWPRLNYFANQNGQFLVVTGEADNFVDVVEGTAYVSEVAVHNLLNQSTLPVRIGNSTNLWGASGPLGANTDGMSLFCGGRRAGLYEIEVPGTWKPEFVAGRLTNQTACIRAAAQFAVGQPGISARPAATFRWYWRGIGPLTDGVTPNGSVLSGTQTATLTISDVHGGDRGLYWCVAENSCGVTQSESVELRVCVADYNCSGVVSVQDIFDFLEDWFAGDSHADMNGAGGTSVQDLFDFLAAYFAGC